MVGVGRGTLKIFGVKGGKYHRIRYGNEGVHACMHTGISS